MESVSNVGVYAKILSTLKDLPLWLITGVALCLAAFLGISAFNGLATPAMRLWITYAAISFAILACCRFVGILTSYVSNHHTKQEQRRTFYLTPVIEQCFIAVSKQPDGSMVTQISGHFLAKNRTDSPLHLINARVVKPKISGEHIQSLLLIKAPQGNMYGTVHVSGHFVPPRGTLPVSVTILTRGMPKRWGKVKKVATVLAFSDDDGNEQRVNLMLKVMSSPKVGIP